MDFKGLILVMILVMSISFVVAIPTGPDSINITANESGSTAASKIINVSGGNITTVNVTASTQNSHWKAFVGWIDGLFTLDDVGGSTIYDWSLASVSGEVYATRASGTVEWSMVNCANQTHIDAEDAALEHTGNDNISSTFLENNTEIIRVGDVEIGAQNCSAIYTYVNDASQTSDFEEILLYDYTNSDIIFATLLEDGGKTGFDGVNYDFQMIVPENANESSSVEMTAYYLYVELS